MELASMLAGEAFSDRPRSVDPVISALLRFINDHTDDDRRQALYGYASAAVGTGRDEEARAWRLERCRVKASALHARRSALRRLLGGPPRSVGRDPSVVELESFLWHLVRSFIATGRSWEGRALAFVDELIEAPPAAGTGGPVRGRRAVIRTTARAPRRPRAVIAPTAASVRGPVRADHETTSTTPEGSTR
jgi:hypothetical protein